MTTAAAVVVPVVQARLVVAWANSWYETVETMHASPHLVARHSGGGGGGSSSGSSSSSDGRGSEEKLLPLPLPGNPADGRLDLGAWLEARK